MGRLVRIGNDGKEVRRSPINTVRARTLAFANGKFFAVAGENRGNGAIRIIEINPISLEMTKQCDFDIHDSSLLWVNAGDLYAVTINLEDKSCYLGRFNSSLALQAKSQIKIHSSATVVVQQGRLFSQREDGSVLILDPAALTELQQ